MGLLDVVVVVAFVLCMRKVLSSIIVVFIPFVINSSLKDEVVILFPLYVCDFAILDVLIVVDTVFSFEVVEYFALVNIVFATEVDIVFILAVYIVVVVDFMLDVVVALVFDILDIKFASFDTFGPAYKYAVPEF